MKTVTESPIEDDFLDAFMRVATRPVLLSQGETHHDLFKLAVADVHAKRVFIAPQAKVENYRADFLIGAYQTPWYPKLVCVECDGKAFHSTPQQKRRDMQRDDYMRGKLITTLRFSGKRIRKDSFACAWEALEEVTSGREKRGNDGPVTLGEAIGGALDGLRPSPLIWSDRK